MARGSFGAVRLATACPPPMPKPTKNVWKISNERCLHKQKGTYVSNWKGRLTRSSHAFDLHTWRGKGSREAGQQWTQTSAVHRPGGGDRPALGCGGARAHEQFL